MEIEKIINSELNNDKSTEIVDNTTQELEILVTEADKYGTDITEMSNFFDIGIQRLAYELTKNTELNVIEHIPIADLNIINDVIRSAEVMMNGKYGYVPDFDNLPHDIKVKFRKGIYKIGESKQVDGNLRAVILDENGTRVKDITLKRVKNNLNTLETSRSILNQAQMRQIYAKLDDIQELQSYQIDRDRDRDILNPFFNARDYIMRAQSGGSLEEKKENLKKATYELTTAINAIYTDLTTSAKHLAKLTGRLIFQRQNQVQTYIGYLTLDLHLATKYVGVQIQVFDYLGDKASSKLALEGYQHKMQEFVSKSINSKGQTAAKLVHSHYSYVKENKDWWYHFADEMKQVLQEGFGSIDEKEIYMVSVEEVKNEGK